MAHDVVSNLELIDMIIRAARRSFATFAMPLVLIIFSTVSLAKLLLAQHNRLDSCDSNHCNHYMLWKVSTTNGWIYRCIGRSPSRSSVWDIGGILMLL